MKFNFKFNRDGNYYFGLILLVVASISILWAFFFDGFDPEDFLVYFLIYAWGFTLLLKSDTEYRLNRLETTVTVLQTRLDAIETGDLPEADSLEALAALEALESLKEEMEVVDEEVNSEAKDESGERVGEEGGCFTQNDD
ncbi:MAG TPA: hypothetical protein DD789_00050 [Firmicutes bacterium]|nr:hypothetical protein [Bacillota bacterium]